MSTSPLNQIPPAQLRTTLLETGVACQLEQAHLFTAPDAFEIEDGNARRRREYRAKKVCAACPAIAACLAYALAIRPVEGIWAGRTAAAIGALAGRLVADGEQKAA